MVRSQPLAASSSASSASAVASQSAGGLLISTLSSARPAVQASTSSSDGTVAPAQRGSNQRAGVERLQLGQRPLAHRPLAGDGAAELAVVQHHELPVARQLDVELDHVDADLHRPLERRPRQLRPRPRGAAVGDAQVGHRAA